MNNDSLKKIYTEHHRDGGRRGKTLFGDERGSFLRERIGKGKRILDIGCRDGELTKTYCAGNSVLGVDVDEESLEKAKSQLNIETKHLNLYEDWGFLENSFDIVVAGEILEHLYYPEKIIQKISFILKPEGALLGSVPNAFSLKNRIRLFFGKKKATPLHDPTHINHFSRRELNNLFKKYFNDVGLFPLGRFISLDKIWPGMFSFMILFEAKNKKIHHE
ncbi:hypothetical protein A2442_00595 [Candidatus Campbellbacteria bacterium RIFOXYC2_FULL_35_25]|uniref:Methyltransferase type 11 domain-containing protein n=1 Tax=Candidatus Campbellbacteria bacterium RIFOXYC2_FULL_35_25 TaxID=1797582 RepID=A0A1F5EJ77_9BACT|nr:MAG: hypothetical protein A2442_00595 [Candidatus Campbellbacteria bacterium RIFOXYC2_FULL_35_25]